MPINNESSIRKELNKGFKNTGGFYDLEEFLDELEESGYDAFFSLLARKVIDLALLEDVVPDYEENEEYEGLWGDHRLIIKGPNW